MTRPAPGGLKRVRAAYDRRSILGAVRQYGHAVAAAALPNPDDRPVVVFNASARLGAFSQNAAFSLLTAWGLRLAGVPVVHFACRAGMSRCVQGTNPDDHTAPPPCKACIFASERLYSRAETHWFDYAEEGALAQQTAGLSVSDLAAVEYRDRPLGQLTLPALRWAARRHHLADDKATRNLFRQYILSAHHVAEEFDRLLEEVKPSTAVIFNGIMFPEAAARHTALARGLRVITHEVSFQPFTCFFTDGQATAYPIHIPEGFELSQEQNERLDAYLSQRFQGAFTMAGIRFWPEIRGLDEDFLARAAQFKQIVPIFTNVVFDTSQVHANTVFPHMFAWLDQVLDLIKAHPETMFIIRAHPDEMRPGTRKQSRESVRQWVENNKVQDLANVVFIDSQEYLSSYDLIQRAKFVMVYNSSIGLEATLLGAAVLCAGQARYTQYPAVFFPQSQNTHRRQAEEFLAADMISIPEDYPRQARRFLYYQLYRASLPFSEFIELHGRPGFVRLKPFNLDALGLESSPALQAVWSGLFENGSFLLEE